LTHHHLTYSLIALCTFLLNNSKPRDSSAHFYVTHDEPYIVCCIEGVKVAKQMHNFGEKRWGVGLVDDFRSRNDDNTRIVGDFTKSVALKAIIQKMHDKIHSNPVWCRHFEQLPEKFGANFPSLHKDLKEDVETLNNIDFKRMRLQIRHFELGDNYYIGT
jgi:hypothetical protein